jgi:hypothetical protein
MTCFISSLKVEKQISKFPNKTDKHAGVACLLSEACGHGWICGNE